MGEGVAVYWKDRSSHRPTKALIGKYAETRLARIPSSGQQGWIRILTTIVEACSTFWVALFKHYLRDDGHESGLLSGLALLGIDNQSHGSTSALKSTPRLDLSSALRR